MQNNAEIITTFDTINFIASITSLVLSIVAIWITLHFKSESDRVNNETRNLLIEIKTDAKVVSQVAMPELKAYDELSRQVIGRGVNMQISNLTTTPEPELREVPPSGNP